METIIFLVILPLFTAFSIGLLRMFNTDLIKKWVLVSSILHLILASITFKEVLSGPIVYELGNWDSSLGIALVADKLSVLLVLLSSFMVLMAVIYSFSYVKLHEFKYYVILKLLLVGLTGMFLTGDLFNLYVFFEITSITSYALVAIKEEAESFEGAFKYLLMGALSGVFVLLAIILIYQSTGALNIAQVASRFSDVPDLTRYAVLSLFTVGFGIKFALFPLHAWLPDAYVGAITPFNALSSALVIKSSLYAFFKMIYLLFGVEFLALGYSQFLIYLAVITLLVAHILAFQQKNLKRILAYSSIAQIGYIVIAFALGTESGFQAGSFHIVNDALMKAALFFCVGIFIYYYDAREIEDIKGIGFKLPLISAMFTIAALAMVGLPPFNGFISKWLILTSVLEAEYLFAVVAILIGSVLSLGYYLKIIYSLYTANDELEVKNISFNLKLPAILLASFCLILGIQPQIILVMLEDISEFLLVAENYISILLGG